MRQRWIERGDVQGRTVARGVLLLLLLLITYLVLGENPWYSGVFDKIDVGQELSIHETILTGAWFGAAINASICLVLLMLSWWWIAPSTTVANAARRAVEKSWRGGPSGSATLRRGGWWFWVLLLLTLVAAAWIRYPRLDHSFWSDEEQAFRNFTWGSLVVPADDQEVSGVPGGDPGIEATAQVAVKRTDWERSLFYTMPGNNHVVHTVSARLADSMWRGFSKADSTSFREAVIRAVPFASGLLTIALLGFWLRAYGFPLVGVVAAVLLALNPWHLRYSVEARGYADLLVWTLLSFMVLGAALDNGRWRWWLACGFCQAMSLLCFAGAIYLVVAQNLIVFALLLVRRDGASLWRWLVGGMIGLMLVVQMLAPAFARIRIWISGDQGATLPMDQAHLLDLWSHLSAGVSWRTGKAGLHNGVSIEDLGIAGPWIFGAVVPLLVVLGVGVALAKARMPTILILSSLGAVGLMWLHHQARGMAFYNWYCFYLVLGLVIGLAFLVELGHREERQVPGRQASASEGKVSWIIATVLVGLYAFITWAPRERLRQFDRQPIRQAVVFARGSAPALDASQVEVLTASTGPGKGQMRSYDPWVQPVGTPLELEKLLERADDQGRQVWVYCSDPASLRRDHSDLFDMLEQETLFARDAYLMGMEERWSIQMYRHDPPDARPPSASPGTGNPEAKPTPDSPERPAPSGDALQ